MTITELKERLSKGKYAFPGGYPMFFITSDGGVLSFEAVINNLNEVTYSIENDLSDGWKVEFVDINWEDHALYCDHTGNKIESAY